MKTRNEILEEVALMLEKRAPTFESPQYSTNPMDGFTAKIHYLMAADNVREMKDTDNAK
mgnify:CR=1 FL=1